VLRSQEEERQKCLEFVFPVHQVFLALIGRLPLSPNPLKSKSLISEIVSLLVHHDQSTNQEEVVYGDLKVNACFFYCTVHIDSLNFLLLQLMRTIYTLYRVSHYYQTRHFFNNSKTNEDIATRFEQGYVRCVRNEEECVYSVCLFRCNIFNDFRIIKEMPGLVGSETPFTLLYILM
jgi:hypothetical protein